MKSKNKNKIVDIEKKLKNYRKEKNLFLKNVDELLIGGLVFLKDILDNPSSSQEFNKLQEAWL
ncbi:MAG: hypothetical protein AB8U25_07145 [Rickettsiales endosymbiont of Dermacentor nuttalli]